MYTTVVSLDKIVILEFFDSPTQILVVILSRKTVSRVMRTEYFSDDRLIILILLYCVKFSL